jgi:chromosome segregation ATPase
MCSSQEERWSESPTSRKRRETMNTHLQDLTKSIAVKENLMTQLIQSKSKYNEMRGFYEKKLQEMEEEVDRVDGDRKRLEEEIQKAEKDGSMKGRAGLEAKLKDKEDQIRKLRTQKKELVGLTRIESRNDTHVARLSCDLQMMKRQRVEVRQSEGNAHTEARARVDFNTRYVVASSSLRSSLCLICSFYATIN